MNHCFVFIFLLSTFNAEQKAIQEPIIKMERSIDPRKSTEIGDYKIDLRGFSVTELLVNLFEIHPSLVSSNFHDERKFNLLIKSETKIDSEQIRDLILNQIEDFAEVRIEHQNIERLLPVVKKTVQFSAPECQAEPGVESSVTIINRTWKGLCVGFDDLLAQLSIWTGSYFVNELNEDRKFNLVVNHSDWGTIINNLQNDYHVSISQELRTVEFVTVSDR